MNSLGSVLAAIALLLQVAVPSLHPPALPSAADGDLSAAFDEHALCLARDDGNPETPANHPPNPDHHAFATCCFWHGSTGLALAHTATLEPITFAQSSVVFPPSKQVFPHRPTGSVGARAPPARA